MNRRFLLGEIRDKIENQDDFEIKTVKYIATADNSPDYASGNILQEIRKFENNVLISTEWRNLSTQQPISEPSSGTFKPVNTEPNDVTSGEGVIAQEDTQQSILTEFADHSTDANQVITHTKLDTLSTKLDELLNLATEATLANVLTQVQSLVTELADHATDANQLAIITELQNIITEFTGLATEAKQDVGNASLSSIDTKLTDNATETTLNSVLTEIQTLVYRFS